MKFDQKIKDISIHLNEVTQTTPWDNFVNGLKTTKFAMGGKPTILGWNRPFETRNVYTLNPLKEEREKVIKTFLNRIGVDLNSPPINASFYDPDTYLPINIKEWKKFIAAKLVDALRTDRQLTIIDLVNELRGKSPNRDADKIAIRLFATDNRMSIQRANNLWHRHNGITDEIKDKYLDKANLSIKTSSSTDPKILNTLHNAIKKYFSGYGVLYLTPQELETYKGGRWAPLAKGASAVASGIKKAWNVMDQSSPTVKF